MRAVRRPKPTPPRPEPHLPCVTRNSSCATTTVPSRGPRDLARLQLLGGLLLGCPTGRDRAGQQARLGGSPELPGPRTRLSVSARDTQRSRVYAAEQFVRSLFDHAAQHSSRIIDFFGESITLPPEARFASVESVQRYVDEVMHLPAVTDVRPIPGPLTVRARRTAAAAHYENSGGTGVIAVPDRTGGGWAFANWWSSTRSPTTCAPMSLRARQRVRRDSLRVDRRSHGAGGRSRASGGLRERGCAVSRLDTVDEMIGPDQWLAVDALLDRLVLDDDRP